MTRTKNLGFLGAAERVLTEAGEPLHYGEITRRALANEWVVTAGKTPDATLYAQFATHIKRQGDSSLFVRVQPGTFGLRRWLDEGQLDASSPVVYRDLRRANLRRFPYGVFYRRRTSDWLVVAGADHPARRREPDRCAIVRDCQELDAPRGRGTPRGQGHA